MALRLKTVIFWHSVQYFGLWAISALLEHQFLRLVTKYASSGGIFLSSLSSVIQVLASVMDIFGLFCTFCSPKWKLKLLPIVVLTSYYDFCHSFPESVCSGLRNSAFL